MMQNDKLRIALSLTDEWDKLDNGSTLVTGVTIIRTDVLEENPAAVEKFLEEYEASINYTETNAEDAAKLIAQYEIRTEGAHCFKGSARLQHPLHQG